MLKIAEFQQLPLLLLGGKPGVKIPHGGKQGLQPGQRRQPIGFGLVLAARDQFQDLPEQARRLVGAGLDGGFVFAGQPLFHALEAGHLLHPQHIGRELIIKRCPLPCRRQPLHLAQQSGSVFQPEEQIGEFLVDACHSLGFGSGGFALFLGLCLRKSEIFFAVGQRRLQQLPPRSGAAGRFG